MPARVVIKNEGANKDLAAWADVQECIVGDLGTEVTYLCSAHGRRLTTRHVTQSDVSSFNGWVTPLGASPTVEFTDVDSAIRWLTAGYVARRDEFDDEVDFRAVTGGQRARFRMAEMAASGAFDPAEFATICVLESHGSLDWGWFSERFSVENRGEWWGEHVHVDDLLASWPDVSPAEIEKARTAFWELRDALDRRFAAEMEAAEIAAMHAAMENA